MAYVSDHAIDRYIERIDGRCTRDDARAAMMTSASVIDFAADFRCGCVRLGNGAKLVLRGETVVTVLERNKIVSLVIGRIA